VQIGKIHFPILVCDCEERDEACYYCNINGVVTVLDTVRFQVCYEAGYFCYFYGCIRDGPHPGPCTATINDLLCFTFTVT
jgi:hypothetical protein